MMNQSSSKTSITVWNLHTRLFHIAIASLTLAALALGILGDDELMIWHFRCGYALIGLIAFRIIIGFTSGDYARFSHSPINPVRILAYLKGQSYAGHNPIGIWMIWALLIAITIQSISGLLTSDSFWHEGPWVRSVDDDIISLSSQIHSYGQVLFFTLITLHIGGNIFTATWKKQDTLKAMINGKKQLPINDHHAPAKPTSLFALGLAILIGATAIWLATNPF